MTRLNGYNKRNIEIENRITLVESSVRDLSRDIVEIRDNHLKHIKDDIDKLGAKMWWGITLAIGVLVGVVVDLATRLLP